MKKMCNLWLLLLGAIVFAAHADSDGARGGTSDVSGYTFFKVRPPFQFASPEKVSLFRGWARKRDCGIGGALQIVPYGGQSTNRKRLGRYFMFCDRDDLFVAGDGATGITPFFAPNQGIGRDVNPSHFNIRTSSNQVANTFQSTIAFRPRQSYAGVGIEYRQYLGWWNDCCEPRWWFDISIPVEWVKNKVNLVETGTVLIPSNNLAEGSAATMTQAFRGEHGFNGVPWVAGRIDDTKKNTKVGVADIELVFGYDWVCNECCYADSYVGVLIPTGNKPKGKYVFEPIVGHDRHVGIITGGSLGYKMYDWDCGRELWLAIDMNSRYEFRNTQTRSFDLCGKPWSRYMAVYANPADAEAGTLSNGINIFTRRMHVHPRFWHNYTTALVYNQCSFQAELGYNFWARQAEKVKLKEAWVPGPVLACEGNKGQFNDASFSRAITIGANFYSDCTQTGDCDNCNLTQLVTCLPYGANSISEGQVIQITDLNLNSAAAPAAMSHTVYGTLGYCWETCNWPMFVGVGGSYEFSGVNTALNRWMVWGKIGFAL